MFRQGKPRSFRHNLRLASLLSFVAGMVNVIGVISVHTLTTNVTGHFAFFAEEFVARRYAIALTFMSFTLSFLAGAFVCAVMVEFMLRRKPAISHTGPLLLEMIILSVVGLSVVPEAGSLGVALPLLFAMGLQNALVTKVSRATVRTTHLTGLFTDLGIELGQLFFYREKQAVKQLRRSVLLRVFIIGFFFLGGISGGFLYYAFELRALIFAAGSLLVALYYDDLRLFVLSWRRKL